jgi:lysozyme family protein
VRELTLDEARSIYKKFYWDLVKGDALPGGLDYCIYDFAVNSGPSRAGRYLQVALNKIVKPEQKLAVDGLIGPHTVQVAQQLPINRLDDVINAVCDARMAFLKGLKNWRTFGNGWTKRVRAVRTGSINMTASNKLEPEVVFEPEKDGDAPSVTRVPQEEKPLSKPENQSGFGALLGIIGSTLTGLFTAIGALPTPVAITLMIVAGGIGAFLVIWLMRNFGDKIRDRVERRLS